MNTRFCVPTLLVAILTVTIAMSVSVNAQNRDHQQTAERRQIGGANRFTPAFERIISVLTEEQRASLRERMAAEREKVRDLEQKIRESRRELFELGLKENFDEAVVKEKADAAGRLDAQMTVLRVKALSQMRPRLTPEQIERIKNLTVTEIGGHPEDSPQRRRDIPRDENGLPLKEKTEKSSEDK